MDTISGCEKQFIYNCIIKRQKRLDGREFSQGRNLEIVFDKQRGCCIVIEGDTRVFVHVTSKIVEPRTNARREGVIQVNFDFSPMASPEAKSFSRTSQDFIEIQRSLERCIRDSKCVDRESLCLLMGSKVWLIRVNVYALNDGGNLIECASIGAISALAHFRRPDVTVIGDEITVHSVNDKEPVPLNILHMPISVNLACFADGKHILVDPGRLEEKVCDGCYIMGVNAHQEICYVHRYHRAGVLLLKEADIIRIEDIAIKRAQEVTQIIRTALDNDAYNRATNAAIGFKNLIQTGTILGVKKQMAEISLDTIQNVPDDNFDNDQFENEDGMRVIGDTSEMRSQAKERALNILQEPEASIFEGGCSKWGDNADADSETSEEEVISAETKPNLSAVKQQSDSEEETVYIDKEQLDRKASNKRGWFIKDPFA